MSENNCAVYVHVNLINGKKYFGITTKDPDKRWKNGYGYYRNAHFMNAIKKYGWDNFGHFVLYENIPIKIAKNIEEMLIKEHMSYDPRFGYNKTMGGELERHTKETREKMSEAKKELYTKHPEKNPMYGKYHSSEKRKEISEATKAAMSRPEVLAKISKPVEAIDPESGKRVLYFKSTMDAERAGFHQGDISLCCNRKRKTHRGYIWRYVKEVSDDGSDN